MLLKSVINEHNNRHFKVAEMLEYIRIRKSLKNTKTHVTCMGVPSFLLVGLMILQIHCKIL